MNCYVKLIALLALTIFFQIACAACANIPEFSDVRDKDWKLTEVRADNGNITFDRSTLVNEGFGDIFTLRFDAERINGVAAPNRYFAPYTLAEKQAIDIGPIAGTLMLAIHEPEKLKERDFFAYLENADKWNLAKGKLELRSTNDEGAAVFLVFVLAD
jgi:hypothetical protein